MRLEDLHRDVNRIALRINDSDAGEDLLALRSRVEAAKKLIRQIDADLNDHGCEWIANNEDLPIGGGKRLGFSYSYETGLTDPGAALNVVLDHLNTITDQEERFQFLLDVTTRSQSGPWLKTGLQKHGINVSPLFYPTASEGGIKKTGKDGEPIRKLTVKDDKYSKKPEKKKSAA